MDSTSQRTGARGRRDRLGQMPRRDALRLFGALSLTATGVGAIGLGAITTRASAARLTIGLTGHGGHGGWNLALLRQDAGTPAPASTPQLGEQPDGTHLWKVRVAGTDEENLIDTQAFFPKEITINVGDAIYFDFPTPPGFHTVTFPSGQGVPPVFVSDDAKGTPAADPPRLIINPETALPSGQDTVDGTSFVNSGLDVFRLPGDPPFMLTFTAPGTFEYQCIPHGVVMKASVVVQEAGSTLPEDQAAVDAARSRSERH